MLVTSCETVSNLTDKVTSSDSDNELLSDELGRDPTLEEILADAEIDFEETNFESEDQLEIAEENDMVNFQRKEEGQYLPIPARVGPEDRMIEGFKEGLRLLREGDHATLFLPYTLAYGEQGVQGIPPQSDLIFMVEIVSVEEPN